MQRIDLNDPKPTDIRVSDMSRVLGLLVAHWLLDLAPEVTPSFAELSMRGAGVLRSVGMPPGTQMAGLLYLANCAYVPQPLIPLKMTDRAAAYLEWTRNVSGPLQRCIMRKYGADMGYNAKVAQTMQGVVSDPIPRLLDPATASLAFELAMLTLAMEIHPRIETCVRLEMGPTLKALDWVTRQALSPSPSAVGSVEALAADLREVFVRHGFEPESQALDALLKALDGNVVPTGTN